MRKIYLGYSRQLSMSLNCFASVSYNRSLSLSFSLSPAFFYKKIFRKRDFSESCCRSDWYHSPLHSKQHTRRTHGWIFETNRQIEKHRNFTKLFRQQNPGKKSNFCSVTSLRNLFRNIAWKYQDARNENLISVWNSKILTKTRRFSLSI